MGPPCSPGRSAQPGTRGALGEGGPARPLPLHPPVPARQLCLVKPRMPEGGSLSWCCAAGDSFGRKRPGITPTFCFPLPVPPSLDLSELAKAAKKKLQAVSGGRGRAGECPACSSHPASRCPLSCCSSATGSLRSWPWTCMTRWTVGRTTRVSGGCGVQPPRAGAGVSARGGAAGGAVAEPRAPPDLDVSTGTAGPSFFIPPAGKVCSERGAAAGCQGWGAAGGGCRDPPGMGAQPGVVPLIWGVEEWGPSHFCGGPGANRRVKPSSLQLGGAELVPERVESMGGGPAGGAGGTPALPGAWGRRFPSAWPGSAPNPGGAGPAPAPASCRLRALLPACPGGSSACVPRDLTPGAFLQSG